MLRSVHRCSDECRCSDQCVWLCLCVCVLVCVGVCCVCVGVCVCVCVCGCVFCVCLQMFRSVQMPRSMLRSVLRSVHRCSDQRTDAQIKQPLASESLCAQETCKEAERPSSYTQSMLTQSFFLSPHCNHRRPRSQHPNKMTCSIRKIHTKHNPYSRKRTAL